MTYVNIHRGCSPFNHTTNPLSIMFDADLVLVSRVPHPGNVYEPAHVRYTFFDPEEKNFIAMACIEEAVVVEVTGRNNLAAEMTLSTRLVDIFRAMKQVA